MMVPPRGNFLFSGLLAIIHMIQKWVLCLFVLAALLPFNILSYDEHQTIYVPKSQRPKYSRLIAQWGQLLKAWIKKAQIHIEEWRSTWDIHQCIVQQRLTARRYANPWRAGHKTNVLIIFQALAMAAATPTEVHQPARFDNDYAPVGIDNRCSACISHFIEDFIDTPRPSN